MFKIIKQWWNNFRKYTPPKEPSLMSDEECIIEVKNFYDTLYVFRGHLTSTEKYRMSLLIDILKYRGFNIDAGATGINFWR